ncbi:MAG: hypothetical protein HY288_15615 [Planctomycetia bacterium]|nr:hypothetical protein [Planctomycetia bacterium]
MCIRPRSTSGLDRPKRRPRLHNRIDGRLEQLEARALLSADFLGSLPAALVQTPSIDDPVTSTIIALSPSANAITDSTAKNPQSKVWQHGNQWWSVIDTAAGTSVYRLDGSSWTLITQISTRPYNADVKPVGNGDVTYAFLYSGSSSQLAKLSYVNGVYQLTPLVSPTAPLASVPLSSGSQTATIDIDSTGRMWVASASPAAVEVRYADAPYTSWSAPITLATLSSPVREIAAIVAFDGKIGVMWSNHVAQRFGFSYHVDGANPTSFSANEVPASQSAKNVGSGMADDHINIKVASDGTIYAAVKTAYDAATMANPEMALLVRRPSGVWDPLYGIDGHGTRQIVELDDAKGFLRYIYAGETGVNDIVYKDIPLAAIDPNQPNKFYSGMDVSNPIYPRQTLIPGGLSKNVSSVKGPFDGVLVIVATNASSGAYSTSGGTGPYTISGAKMVDAPVSGANQPPVNSVPPKQLVLKDSPLVFSRSGNNSISVSDPDAGLATVQVSLAATNGTLLLPSVTGLSTVFGNGTASITMTAPIAAINSVCDGLVFRPDTGFVGNAAVTITTNDLGNTGAGGPVSVTTGVSITVSDHPWTNPILPQDTNADGRVSVSDLLLLINDMLANNGPHLLPPPPHNGVPNYPDVNGDGSISPVDALRVINILIGSSTPDSAGGTSTLQSSTGPAIEPSAAGAILTGLPMVPASSSSPAPFQSAAAHDLVLAVGVSTIDNHLDELSQQLAAAQVPSTDRPTSSARGSIRRIRDPDQLLSFDADPTKSLRPIPSLRPT